MMTEQLELPFTDPKIKDAFAAGFDAGEREYESSHGTRFYRPSARDAWVKFDVEAHQLELPLCRN